MKNAISPEYKKKTNWQRLNVFQGQINEFQKNLLSGLYNKAINKHWDKSLKQTTSLHWVIKRQKAKAFTLHGMSSIYSYWINRKLRLTKSVLKPNFSSHSNTRIVLKSQKNIQNNCHLARSNLTRRVTMTFHSKPPQPYIFNYIQRQTV